jgi:tetratricopeptide (TPR) repeat protein
MRVATALLAVAVIAACAVKTEAQVKVWKDTVTLFNHVLEIDPRGELPNSSLGVAYVRQGRIAEAQQYLERSLDYNPTWPLTLSYSALCLMRTAMQTHEQGNLPLARQRLEQALRVAPDDPDVLTNLALWSALMGSRKDEETYSRKVLAARPDFITARLYLADSLQAQGRLDDAVQENRQVLAIEPDNDIAHNNLGTLFSSQGLTEEALKEFRLSLAVKPEQATIHFKIGRILAETHRLPEAVEEFTQALRFDPANAYTHNDLGVALFLQGDYQKAAEQFREAMQTNPAYTDARRNLDLAQVRMKTEKAENGKK